MKGTCKYTEYTELHNKEFCVLYSSPNIIGVLKSRRMRQEWHVAHMWEMMNTCMVSVGKAEGKRKTLKWLLRKWDDKSLTGLIWLRIRTSGRLL